MEDLVRDVIVGMGYTGLALLVALENLFPPIPSELILPLAGFYVGRGEFSFLPALLSSTAGSVGGALVLYGIARWGGRRVILRFHALLRVDEADLGRLDEGFRRHGLFYVAGARLLPGLRSAVSVPAGIARMPLLPFFVLTTLGSAVWNAALIGAGVYLGANFDRVSDLIGPASAVILAVAATAIVAWWVRRRRRSSPGQEGG
jgi:membrane protein DedA with SNARE-associated domain